MVVVLLRLDVCCSWRFFFFFQAEDGIRDLIVTGVQTCALPISAGLGALLEPTLLRPLYKRAEEYQLLITFGLLLILEDLMRLIWGPYPLSVSAQIGRASCRERV